MGDSLPRIRERVGGVLVLGREFLNPFQVSISHLERTVYELVFAEVPKADCCELPRERDAEGAHGRILPHLARRRPRMPLSVLAVN
jgi:hypothetical protein